MRNLSWIAWASRLGLDVRATAANVRANCLERLLAQPLPQLVALNFNRKLTCG